MTPHDLPNTDAPIKDAFVKDSSIDPLIQKIIETLDQQAMQHPKQQQVLQYVMRNIKQRKASKRHVWAMSGFALAAAITGVTLLPNLLVSTSPSTEQQLVNTVKLSPQMIEDLEMLSLLGTESAKYGS